MTLKSCLSHYQPLFIRYHCTGNCFMETASVNITPHYGTAGTCRFKSLFYPNWLDTGIWSVLHLENTGNVRPCDPFRSKSNVHKIEFWKQFHNLLSLFLLIYTAIVWIYIFINFGERSCTLWCKPTNCHNLKKLLQWNFIFIHKIHPPFHFSPPRSKWGF